jgi:hypothetical protein
MIFQLAGTADMTADKIFGTFDNTLSKNENWRILGKKHL